MKFTTLINHNERLQQALADPEIYLPAIASDELLCAREDAWYLSMMSLRVFRAGLKHSLVDAKWPAFEDFFFGFDPKKMVLVDGDFMDRAIENKALIRHWGKLNSIPKNAQMILDVIDIQRQEGALEGFGHFLTSFGIEQTAELWWYLKTKGAHLGGRSGGSFLRMVGKDTFLLTDDVIAALENHKLVEKVTLSRKGLNEVQSIFNDWHQETGMPLSHLSRLLSMTVDRTS